MSHEAVDYIADVFGLFLLGVPPGSVAAILMKHSYARGNRLRPLLSSLVVLVFVLLTAGPAGHLWGPRGVALVASAGAWLSAAVLFVGSGATVGVTSQSGAYLLKVIALTGAAFGVAWMWSS